MARSEECPYGGSTCHVCLYITTLDERADRYSHISSGYRGVKSKVNDRGDIIACLPISSRPQSSTQNIASTSGERRGVTTSPLNRIPTTSTSGRTVPTLRSQQYSRSSASSRIPDQPRPQATRIQPPRGQRTRMPSNNASSDSYMRGDEPSTPTKSSSGATSTRGLRSASMTSILVDDSPTDVSPAKSNDITGHDALGDGRSTRRLRRAMKMDDSYNDFLPHERDSNSYSFRSRKSSNDVQRDREIEHSRYFSSILGPLGLSHLAWKDPNTQDIPCALCGIATESSRSKRTRVNKVSIGGSNLAKNAIVGPFATTKRFMNTLEDEFPKIFDRLGRSLFMHNGCLAVATYLALDPTSRRIVNFPEVMVRGLYTRCAYCSGNFATLHCCYADCNRAFHYPCAMLSFEDEAYQNRQPTAERNPAFLTRLNNIPDPHMSDRFLCLECTLRSWVDASPSLEPFCTGEIFMAEEHRQWFYGDERDEWPIAYVPQGGDLIIVSSQSQAHMKANSAAMWTFQAKSQLLTLKKLDYRFCGPISGQFGVSAVMSLQPIEDKKRISLFYYPGVLTVYPLIDLMMGLWRLSKLSSGDVIKVRHADGWKEAVVASFNKPYVCGGALGIIPGNYGMANVALIAKAAVNMGTSCIQVEPDAQMNRKWFSAWEVICGTPEESKLLDDIRQQLFPPEAKEQLVNLTLDPEYVDFNNIPTCEESTEEWVKTYWMTIPNPMSLEKIRQRILNSYYICPQGAIADLDVIVQNCKFFNDASSYICEILKTLEQSISTLRDDLRRLMNPEKYARIVMQLIWPDVEEFFAKQEEETDATAVTANDVTCDEVTASNAVVKHKAPVDLDDDDVPLRRSSRLIQAKPPPVVEYSDDSDTPQKKWYKRNLDDSDLRSPDRHVVGTRRSSRLAQSDVSYSSKEGTSVSSQDGKYRNTRRLSTIRSSSSLSMASAESNSSQRIASSAEEMHSDRRTERRQSSKVAEIAKKEAERLRNLEQQKEENERLQKLQRYSSVRYSLRERQ